jgi:hypothetical protein
MALTAEFLTVAMACRTDSDTCDFNGGFMNCYWPISETKRGKVLSSQTGRQQPKTAEISLVPLVDT